MAQSLLTDVKQVTFTNDRGSSVDFDAQILDWADSRVPRLAAHEPLKRDGAIYEFMGRRPHRVRFNVIFLGDTWRQSFLRLQTVVEESPFGTLTHPFFDRLKMVCEGIDGAKVVPGDALDTVSLPISFVENALDNTLALTEPPTTVKIEKAAAYSQNLSTFTDSTFVTPSTTAELGITTASRIYVTAAFAIAAFQAQCNAYTVSAFTVATGDGVTDFTLNQKLGAAITGADAAAAAVYAEASDPVDAFDAIIAIELAIDALCQVDAQLRQDRPVVAPFIVPVDMTLITLAQMFYGPDAAAKIPNIQADNVGKIPNPARIAAGTVLLMETATVSA